MSKDLEQKSTAKWQRYEELVRGGYLKSVLYGDSSSRGWQIAERAVRTGFIGFDLATGFGGIPRGMLVEIFGETDTGKTALALHFALSIQNSGGKSVYLDTEGKFQDSFARLLGLKDDAFSICENQGAEEIFEICELLALGGSVDLVILDSLTALLTGEEYDLLYKDAVSPVELPESAAGVDIEDYPVFSEEVDSVNKAGNTGAKRVLPEPGIFRVLERGLRRLQTVSAATGCTFILINQTRSNFESITASAMQSTGGSTVFLRAGLRIQLFRNSEITLRNEAVGVNICARLVKNNYSLRCLNIWLVFYYATGFCVPETLILNALQLGVLQKKDGLLYYKEQVLGKTRAEICRSFADIPDLVVRISDDMRAEYL